MIKIENTEVVGWEAAIRGMRNPKNSWDRMDSEFDVDWFDDSEWPHKSGHDDVVLGPNDHKLMMNLAAGGPVHAKYRRMIVVYVDITAPLYWWKEFDTYKVGTVANSCSTMHKIHDKEFEESDFSCEHLMADDDNPMYSAYNDVRLDGGGLLGLTINVLNYWRRKFLEVDKQLKDINPPLEFAKLQNLRKKYWWQMIQLLPSSYNQKRTIMLNYEVLVGMYRDRKNHKLDEWHDFCDWIKGLPYSEIIVGPEFLEKDMNIRRGDE